MLAVVPARVKPRLTRLPALVKPVLTVALPAPVKPVLAAIKHRGATCLLVFPPGRAVVLSLLFPVFVKVVS